MHYVNIATVNTCYFGPAHMHLYNRDSRMWKIAPRARMWENNVFQLDVKTLGSDTVTPLNEIH